MKTIIRKGISGVERRNRVEQGFFDGRFATKQVKSKKSYTRKSKHKKSEV
jgi:hypothetical protein